MSAEQNERQWGLDLTRAIAALMVFVTHFWANEFSNFSEIAPVESIIITENLGFLGVQLFFTLSGFLIGHRLLRLLNPYSIDLGIFWIRRLLRTVPVYLIVLTFSCYLNKHWKPYPSYAFYLGWHPFNSSPSFFLIESWSLAVEEWYYLLIPPLFLFLRHKLSINKIKSIFYILFILTIIRYYSVQYLEDHSVPGYARFSTPVHLDSIAWGFLLAAIPMKKKHVCLAAIIGMGLVLISFIWRAWEFKTTTQVWETSSNFNFWGYIIVSIGCAIMLPFISSLKYRKNYFTTIFSKIALISYPIYLVHRMVILLLVDFKNLYSINIKEIDVLIKLMLAIFLVALCSWLLHWVVEQPCLRFSKFIQTLRQRRFVYRYNF